MESYLNYSASELEQKKAYWTAKEICQQGESWLQTADIVENQRSQLDAWLSPILANNNLRIILTGAGTSAYVGETLYPHLTSHCQRVFEAISTTDLVSNGPQLLIKEQPTLVISYGRSGSSPESVAACEAVDALVDNSFHLVITCNKNGELAQKSQTSGNYYSLLMPEQTLDKSFAMTSSFSSMLVATLSVFAPDQKQLNTIVNWANFITSDEVCDAIYQETLTNDQRLVFLGSGGLTGIAREAALKVLELTAGRLLSYFESSLGFRHGPKSLVDANTAIVVFKSNNHYTSQYDQDLINELKNDNQASSVKVIDHQYFNSQAIDDVWASLPFLMYAQIYAFYKSVEMNISPDNPCPTGEVNRVVQGVTIYPVENV